jgi:hypothetical protein
MNKYLYLILCLFLSTSVFAQKLLKGQVLDDRGLAINNVLFLMEKSGQM